MEKLFPKKNGVNLSKVQLSPNSSYSITPQTDVKYIDKILKKHIPRNNLVIVDATGNVGGDTINFALNPQVSYVVSVEINKDTFENLKHNVNLYNLTDKVTLLNNDSSKLLEECKLKGDVLYIDAPWGGKDYKKFAQMNLYLGTQTLSNVIKNTYKCQTFNYIMIKVPYNYKIKSILDLHKTTNMHIYKIKTKSRYYLICFIRI